MPHALCAIQLLLMFFQLKVFVTELDDKLPHLIFVAKRSMEVGEELLFDYSDRDSRLSFLNQCPVCM